MLQLNATVILTDTSPATRVCLAAIHAKQHYTAAAQMSSLKQASTSGNTTVNQLQPEHHALSSNPLLGGIVSIQRPHFSIFSNCHVAVKRCSINACDIAYSTTFTSHASSMFPTPSARPSTKPLHSAAPSFQGFHRF